ncbi:MAG: transcriptional regulator, partial [Pseudomonadota bacterium]
GLRKLRWQAPGTGKSGGYRIIYYWRNHRGQIWLLTIYAKNEAENIPAHILKAIKEEIVDD